MSHCPRCKQSIRRDDSLTRMEFDGGSQQVCQQCAAQIRGDPAPPEPKAYPVLPDGHVGYPFGICGLCRLALYFDDDATKKPLRITAEQALGTSYKEGLYSACRDCRAKFGTPQKVQDALAGVCDPETGLPPAVPKTGIAI